MILDSYIESLRRLTTRIKAKRPDWGFRGFAIDNDFA